MKVVVEIVYGARAGRRLEFDDPQVVRFGRHPTCDVAFDPTADRDASSRHAELKREDGLWFLTDLGSANGTRIGDVAVNKRAPVVPGAEIEFGAGGPRCRITFDGPQAGTVPPTMAKPGASLPGAAPATGPKVGARTVALMINDAMLRARGASKRLQLAVAGLAVALVGTVIALVAIYRAHPPADAAVRREMVKIMDEQRAASREQQAELQKKLDELQSRLARARGASAGAEIARAAHDALFLVTVKTSIGNEEGFCTAFAISTERLITNAHCVAAAEDLRRRSGQIFVVQNGHPDVRFAVERMKRVSGFQPGGASISPDVGWLKVAGGGGILHTVTLAPAAEYQRLSTGDPMFTYGFPGRLADVSAPEATFVEGVVGRITTLDGRSGDVKETRLIQHSAFTSGGTSGSPIFDAEGHVVAVNTGGYAEAQGASQAATRSLPGYNFGMRVDLVEQLLSEADE